MYDILSESQAHCSTKEGTPKEKSALVATIASHTASGVGTSGGEEGLNVAMTNPVIG